MSEITSHFFCLSLRLTSAWLPRRWRTDPVFSPYYHEVGRVTGAHSSPEKIAALRERYDRSQREGWGVGYEWLDDEEAIVTRIPQLKGGDLKVWGCVRSWDHCFLD